LRKTARKFKGVTHHEFNAVNRCIRAAAARAAAADSLSAPLIERFLRIGEETWDGAGSGRFTLAQFKEDEAYTRAAKTARRTLLHLRRGQERFVDVEFSHRELFAIDCEAYSRVVLHGELKSRLSFAEEMLEGAFSFPRGHIEEVAPLVLSAARARNGWHVIREAAVIHRTRRLAKAVT